MTLDHWGENLLVLLSSCLIKWDFIYHMTVNPGSNNIAFCKHLNNSMCPTYKESSGYTGGIKYCVSKFGSIHSQWPLEQWLSIDTYVELATLSMCLRSHSCNMLSLVNWSQRKWPSLTYTSNTGTTSELSLKTCNIFT